MNDIPMNIQEKGLAIDIDDTISDTFRHFATLVQEKFSNPEGMTVDEIVERYKIMTNVPFWQTPEIRGWLAELSLSNEAQEAVIPIMEAASAVQKLNMVVPVRMYITSRPSTVVEGSKRWLTRHGFPEAELITRPLSEQKIDGNLWKAEILKNRYPEITALIDDNSEIIRALGDDYQGRVYLFGSSHEVPQPKPDYVIPCNNWQEVYEAITGKKA